MEVWPYRPSKTVESLEFYTDIIRCKAAEWRRSPRKAPRIWYNCTYRLDPQDYGLAREHYREIGGVDIFVPDWPNEVRVGTVNAGTSTLSVDSTRKPAIKVGRSVLIYVNNSDYEVVEVTAINVGTIGVTPTVVTHVNPLIVPLRTGHFTQEFIGERGPFDHTDARAVFRCTDTEDLSGVAGGIGYPTYRGDPVVTDPIVIIGGATDEIQVDLNTLDSITGPVYRHPTLSTAVGVGVVSWVALGEATSWALRVWIHSRRGCQKQFWTSSWNADVRVSRAIHGGDSNIEIHAIGFASRYKFPVDLAITAHDGGIWPVRVTAAAPGSLGKELLTLSTPFVGEVALTSIRKTCKLTLSRFDSDRIEIQHLVARQSKVVVPTKEVPVLP